MGKVILVSTTEIAGAVVGGSMDYSDLGAFVGDARGFLSSEYGVDIDLSIDVFTVGNSMDTVHLALPYYSQLDSLSSASGVSDSSMSSASGGVHWMEEILDSYFATMAAEETADQIVSAMFFGGTIYSAFSVSSGIGAMADG